MNLDFENVSDEILWLKVREGKLDAFEALYSRLFKLLYHYGYRICHNSTLVEDSIHDLFLDVWRYREKLFATTSVRFYLFSSLRRRIARNNESDSRKSMFEFDLGHTLLQNAFTQEEVMIENEDYDERIAKLKKHLQDLPPRQYEALMLKFYNELSYPEIATILSVNEQSARNLVQRGLELLRKYSHITISAVLIGGLCFLYGLTHTI